MKKINRDKVNTLAILFKELENRSKIDDGAVGKAAEISIKSYINPNSSIKDKVTSNGKTYDLFVMENGKRANLEIKTACGELAIVESVEDKTPAEMLADVYPKSTYILYCPEVAFNIPLEEQFFVFHRNAFIEMCENYSGRGSLIRIKSTTNNSSKLRLSFQSFRSEGRPKASQPIANYLWDCCYEQPTVKQWLNMRES